VEGPGGMMLDQAIAEAAIPVVITPSPEPKLESTGAPSIRGHGHTKEPVLSVPFWTIS